MCTVTQENTALSVRKFLATFMKDRIHIDIFLDLHLETWQSGTILITRSDNFADAVSFINLMWWRYEDVGLAICCVHDLRAFTYNAVPLSRHNTSTKSNSQVSVLSCAIPRLSPSPLQYRQKLSDFKVWDVNETRRVCGSNHPMHDHQLWLRLDNF